MAHVTAPKDSDRAGDLQEIVNIWRTYFPNERFGQFLCNCMPQNWNSENVNEDFGRFLWETPLDCILVVARVRVKKIVDAAEEGLKALLEKDKAKARGQAKRTIGFVDGQLVTLDLSDIYDRLDALEKPRND